jgi:hypothetical protein
VKKLLLALVATAAMLAGCASPRTASFTDGSVTNITSAEATTLAKVAARSAKVTSVQTNQKPILKLVGHPGKPITMDLASFEVYVPQDLNVLLAEQASEVSENVQVLDRVARMGERVVAPLAAIGFAADVAKRKSDNALAAQLDANATQRASDEADAATTDSLVQGLKEKPQVIFATPYVPPTESAVIPAVE